MRKILLILILICSLGSVFGQGKRFRSQFLPPYPEWNGYFVTPLGYQYRTVREKLIAFIIDSGFHLPSYNGVPVGLRNGVWIGDGALSADTLNHALYLYSGGVHNKQLSIRDTFFISTRAWRQKGDDSLAALIKTYTASLPVRITGTVISADTSKAYNPSLLTNQDFKRRLDSAMATVSSSNFANTNLTFTGNRTHAMAGNTLKLTSAGAEQFFINPDSRYRFGAIDDGVGAAMGLDIDNVAGTVKLGSLTGFTGLSLSALPTRYIKLDIAGTNYFHIDGSGNFFLPQGLTAGSSTDSVVVIDPSTGQLKKRNAASFGGSSGTNNANIGSGFRWLKPTAQDIKTLHAESGILADSSSHTDEITIKADTTYLKTKAGDQKTTDSILAILNIQANPKDQYQYYMEIAGVGNANYQLIANGTGAAVTRPNTAFLGNWYGNVKGATGTTTSGTIYGHYNPNLVYFPMSSSVRYNYGLRLRFEDLSDGTETYKFWAGYYDDHFTPPSSLLDGVFITYTHSESSGQFVFHTMNNGTESTSVGTGVTVAADTDYYLQISVFGGDAKFYVNGTLIATISTNIPDDDAARTMSIEFTFKKSAGTTSRDIYVGQLSYGTVNF